MYARYHARQEVIVGHICYSRFCALLVGSQCNVVHSFHKESSKLHFFFVRSLFCMLSEVFAFFCLCLFRRLTNPKTRHMLYLSSNTTQLLFRPPKSRTTTFQKSYFARVTRVWNCLLIQLRQANMLLSTFKRLLRDYYLVALHICYDAEDPKTWKSVCLNCNCGRSLNSVTNCCF